MSLRVGTRSGMGTARPGAPTGAHVRLDDSPACLPVGGCGATKPDSGPRLFVN